ncbi:hypothetical protein GCM10023322_84350 [Rugosimonospora acidiphila]|uniref:Uncharacterized protein n=1 Tax=Rugosimonospora acidiphila TaxID=556531 RepID=A0ABP9SWA2_9ACTN
MDQDNLLVDIHLGEDTLTDQDNLPVGTHLGKDIQLVGIHQQKDIQLAGRLEGDILEEDMRHKTEGIVQ